LRLPARIPGFLLRCCCGLGLQRGPLLRFWLWSASGMAAPLFSAWRASMSVRPALVSCQRLRLGATRMWPFSWRTRRPASTARVMVLRWTPRRAANWARVSVLGRTEAVISEAPVEKRGDVQGGARVCARLFFRKSLFFYGVCKTCETCKGSRTCEACVCVRNAFVCLRYAHVRGVSHVLHVLHMPVLARVRGLMSLARSLARLARHWAASSACWNSKKQSVSHWLLVLPMGGSTPGGMMVGLAWVLPS